MTSFCDEQGLRRFRSCRLCARRVSIHFAKTVTIRQEPTSIMKRYSSFTLAFALALSALAIFAPTIRRAAAFDGDAYAIKGGTVVTVTGATIQKGTVIIRNGL